MKASPLLTLVYKSRAVSPFSIEELDDLLERAREFNRRHEITGMLVYLAGRFMQALEGPEENVAKLFSEKISHDSRHELIVVVTKGKILERRFGEWTMAFRNLDGVEDRPDGFSEFLEKGITDELVTENETVAAAILNRFKRRFSPLDGS